MNEACLVLTSDQIVLFHDTVREKPVDDSEAISFLSSYSNNHVSTVSAVVITEYPSGIQSSGTDIATVYWKQISDEVVNKVVAKRDVFNSAGGFCIEDDDLNPLIDHIQGTVDSVMGLPLELTVRLLREVIQASC